jgi:hypothetical protein
VQEVNVLLYIIIHVIVIKNMNFSFAILVVTETTTETTKGEESTNLTWPRSRPYSYNE